jgi:hypothetical protein
MVKGIRAHKTEHAGNANAEAEYIAKCMAEIKTELQVRWHFSACASPLLPLTLVALWSAVQ